MSKSTGRVILGMSRGHKIGAKPEVEVELTPAQAELLSEFLGGR